MDVRIERVFRDVLEDRKLVVNDATSPANTPAWDSFAQVKLVLALEDEFGMTFDVDELAEVGTAGDLATALRRRGVVLT